MESKRTTEIKYMTKGIAAMSVTLASKFYTLSLRLYPHIK